VVAPGSARRRGGRLGLRARVLASFLLLLVVAEACSLGLLHRVGISRLDEQVDRELNQAADDFRSQVLAAGPLDAGDGRSVANLFDTFLATRAARTDEAFLAIVDGVPIASSPSPPLALEKLEAVPAWVQARDSRLGDIDSPAGPARYLVVPVLADGAPVGALVVIAFLDDRRAAIESTVVSISLITALVLLASCVLAWAAAGRALRPVRELAATAQRVADGDDLTRRLPVRSSDDELGQLTDSFNEMLDRLQGAFATQKEFLDSAGHELRTPITIVRGHLELMGDDAEERRETVALVLDELDRMDRLVDELRLLARSQRPDFLTVAPTDLDIFATDLLAKATALAPRSWRVERDARAVVDIDRQRLTEAAINLIDNAAHVTEVDAPIELRVSWRDGTLVVAVRDEGPGIADTDVPHLFDREHAVSHRPGGTGLGLPIVAAIAAAHGGSVSVDTRLGRGSTFTIRVPAPESGNGHVAAYKGVPA
jgi:two-component system OmpR family sensor kinase